MGGETICGTPSNRNMYGLILQQDSDIINPRIYSEPSLQTMFGLAMWYNFILPCFIESIDLISQSNISNLQNQIWIVSSDSVSNLVPKISSDA